MPRHPLTNFEIQKCYQNKPRFNGDYSRDSLPDKIKHWVYVINLDEHSGIGTHLIAWYSLNNNITYFDNFWVENIPKKNKKFLDNENIQENIFRIQACDSVMWRHFFIRFIDFMLAEKILTDSTNLFLPIF